MKLNGFVIMSGGTGVAPLAGAWIETGKIETFHAPASVAPLAGAWIETKDSQSLVVPSLSHPSRVRGLKHARRCRKLDFIAVAPLAGAWIET